MPRLSFFFRMILGRLRLRAVTFVAALLVVFGGRAEANAEPGTRGPLERAAEALASARTPLAQVGVLRLMSAWDLEDPGRIEATLARFAESSRGLEAAYARFWLAEARRRRGDAAAAARIEEGLGFARAWVLVGPFPDENRTGIDARFGPEEDLAGAVLPSASFDGLRRSVRFRPVLEDTRSPVIDLGGSLRPREPSCGFATTFVRADEKVASRVTIAVGVEGAFKLFVGADEVLADTGYRGFDVDRFVVGVELRPGTNRITLKTCNDTQSPAFALRFLDARGEPDRKIQISNDVALYAGRPAGKKGEAKAQTSLRGGLQAFDASVAGKTPRASDLEAYAEYLLLSRGDPRGQHRARDMATRAFEIEPTVPRAVMASRLAEDRNQSRALLDRSPPAAADDPELALAYADLEQGSLRPTEAIVHLDEALRRAPNDVRATIGKAAMLSRKDLHRTALASLREALLAHPTSVALTRAAALELRALGREVEADELDERWAAFRENDRPVLRGRIEAALTRGDHAAALAHAERFGRFETDDVTRRMVLAQVYRATGRPAQAKSTLEAGLAIVPDDVDLLRTLADFAGEAGDRGEQLRYLRKILVFYPQAKDIRAYAEHIEPPKPRADEAYAWDEKTIRKKAEARPDPAFPRRTLRNVTVTTIFQNGLASRYRQLVVQPFTDDAASSSRQLAFAYQADRQAYEIRGARVLHPDGTVTEGATTAEAAANDPSIAMYTSTRVVYVQFERVQKGDLVELSYRVDDVSPRNDVADHFGEIEAMQSDEPIGVSEYHVISPKARKLQTFVYRVPGIEVATRESGDERIHSFVARDVKPIVGEPGMPPTTEILGQVHVSTFASWDELGAWYWGLARDQIDVDDGLREKLKSITKGLGDDAAKVKAVYKYVTELRYVALEFGIEGIKPRRCTLTLARGWGDCKDKAAVIVSMLRELGIDATMVLVRSGQRGDLPAGAPPSLSAFDHAIAYVPSLDLYLDGTAEGSGSTELPTMDQNAVVLLVNAGKAKLARLPTLPAERNLHRRKIDVELDAKGGAVVSVDSTISGSNAAAWRGRYRTVGTRRERAARDLSEWFGPTEVQAKDPITVDADDTEVPFHLAVRGRIAALSRGEEGRFALPIGLSLGLLSSVASLSTRTQPVIVAPLVANEETRTIVVPPGMAAERLPEAVNVSSPYGSVEVVVTSSGNKVIVKTKLTLTRARIEPTEYPAFRQFCQAVDAALSQRLVVSKNTN